MILLDLSSIRLLRLSLSNNIEVYKEPVPPTKEIPHHAIKFGTGEENRIVHESLYWNKLFMFISVRLGRYVLKFFFSATYTFIGGLGATFYVSYFNTSIMFIIMLIFLAKVYNEPSNDENPLGEFTSIGVFP